MQSENKFWAELKFPPGSHVCHKEHGFGFVRKAHWSQRRVDFVVAQVEKTLGECTPGELKAANLSEAEKAVTLGMVFLQFEAKFVNVSELSLHQISLHYPAVVYKNR